MVRHFLCYNSINNHLCTGGKLSFFPSAWAETGSDGRKGHRLESLWGPGDSVWAASTLRQTFLTSMSRCGRRAQVRPVLHLGTCDNLDFRTGAVQVTPDGPRDKIDQEAWGQVTWTFDFLLPKLGKGQMRSKILRVRRGGCELHEKRLLWGHPVTEKFLTPHTWPSLQPNNLAVHLQRGVPETLIMEYYAATNT